MFFMAGGNSMPSSIPDCWRNQWARFAPTAVFVVSRDTHVLTNTAIAWSKHSIIRGGYHTTFCASLITDITPLLYSLHWLPISSRIQYKIALICFYIVSGTAPSSRIPLRIASSLLSFSLPSLTLGCSDLPCSDDGQQGPGEKILSAHRTCHLEPSSSLCQAFFFSLFFSVTTENLSLLFCLLIPFSVLFKLLCVWILF